MKCGARFVERAKLAMIREGPVGRRRATDETVAIGDRDRFLDSDQRSQPLPDPVLAGVSIETFAMQQPVDERPDEAVRFVRARGETYAARPLTCPKGLPSRRG